MSLYEEEKKIYFQILDSVNIQHYTYFHHLAPCFDSFLLSFLFKLPPFPISETACPQTIGEIAGPNVCAFRGSRNEWSVFVVSQPDRISH